MFSLLSLVVMHPCSAFINLVCVLICVRFYFQIFTQRGISGELWVFYVASYFYNLLLCCGAVVEVYVKTMTIHTTSVENKIRRFLNENYPLYLSSCMLVFIARMLS